MRAFYKVGDQFIKAYDMGEDWRLIDANNGVERWFSKWAGNEYGSLTRAYFSMLGCFFDESKLTLCERG